MSSNLNPQPPRPDEVASADSRAGQNFVLGGTTERAVAPDEPFRGAELPAPRSSPATSATTFDPASLDDIDEEIEAEEEGYGPKFVVLHDFVLGHPRGSVVSLSRLLAQQHEFDAEEGKFTDERAAKIGLKRLLDLKAVRPANEEESKHRMVTFVEGEEALAAGLIASDAARSKAESESARLRKLIESVGGDPNASPEELAAQLKVGKDAEF